MEYRVICDEEALLKEREAWTDIYMSMDDATPFQSFEWAYYWWKNNEPVESLYILKAFENKDVYGYAPIVIKNNTAEFIGGRDMDYGRFIVRFKEMAVIEGFLNHLLEKGFSLALQEMAARNTQTHMVQKLLEDKSGYMVHRTTRASYVDLKRYPGYDEYFSLLSRSMRIKTLKEGEKAGFNISAEPVTDSLFQDIEDIYSDRQNERGGTSDISWSFNVIREMNRANMLDVYMAGKDGKPAGFLVAFKDSKAKYIWLVGFKEEYKSGYPGQMLFNEVIKSGFKDNMEYIDFMRGDYDFKMRWECELDSNYTVYVDRSKASHVKRSLYFKVKPKAKKIVYGNDTLKRIYKKHAR